MSDQAKAIADLRATAAAEEGSLWQAIVFWANAAEPDMAELSARVDAQVSELIDRAVSISRASQGSGATEEDRLRVARALFDLREDDEADWNSPACREVHLAEADAAIAALPTPESFQARVAPWMLACFGVKISGDMVERGDRLLEEVLELLQSGGYDPARVAPLRDYVYGRPTGEPVQEAGGVMVTLAAYCLAADLDMHDAGETELARVWTKVDKIREKQAAKQKLSPLPIALSPPATPQAPEDVRRKAEQAIRDAGYWHPDDMEIASALDRAHLLATPVTVTISGEMVNAAQSVWDKGQWTRFDRMREVLAVALGMVPAIHISRQSEGPK